MALRCGYLLGSSGRSRVALVKPRSLFTSVFLAEESVTFASQSAAAHLAMSSFLDPQALTETPRKLYLLNPSPRFLGEGLIGPHSVQCPSFSGQEARSSCRNLAAPAIVPWLPDGKGHLIGRRCVLSSLTLLFVLLLSAHMVSHTFIYLVSYF